jgi:hypothetical protein
MGNSKSKSSGGAGGAGTANRHQQQHQSPSAPREPEVPHSTLRGLYATCEWDARTIRSLVASKRVAPIVAGVAEEMRVASLDVRREEREIGEREFPLVLISHQSHHQTIDASRHFEECPICLLVTKRFSFFPFVFLSSLLIFLIFSVSVFHSRLYSLSRSPIISFTLAA